MSSLRPALGAAPTLAIVNARIWTADPMRPWADALAIVGDRLSIVGSSAEARKLATPATRVWDASGRMIVPGFVNENDRVHIAGALTRGAVANVVVLERALQSVEPNAVLPDAVVHLAVAQGRIIRGSVEP